jgi:hypothetical protein
MKYLFSILSALFLSGIILLTSCSKSSDPEPDQSPSISFVPGTGFVSSDVTLKVNSLFKVRIDAASNVSSGAPLTRFTITWVRNNDRLTLVDTTINMNKINTDISAQAYSQAGQEKWYFKVTDKNNISKEIVVTITTTANKSNGPLHASVLWLPESLLMPSQISITPFE